MRTCLFITLTRASSVPVARSATLLRYPDFRKAIEELAGRISIADMRRMNRAVDSERQDPSDVARTYLASLEHQRPSKR